MSLSTRGEILKRYYIPTYEDSLFLLETQRQPARHYAPNQPEYISSSLTRMLQGWQNFESSKFLTYLSAKTLIHNACKNLW